MPLMLYIFIEKMLVLTKIAYCNIYTTNNTEKAYRPYKFYPWACS